MNLSMQLGRGLIALTLSLALGAYAATRASTEDAHADTCAANVAHGRLAIVDLHDSGETPHWFVASVHVGDPIPAPVVHARPVASHIRANDSHG